MFKKHYLFVALLFATSISFAQKTTIPDEIFRQLLIADPNLGVDIIDSDFNNQYEIDNTKLSQIKILIIPPPNVFVQIPLVGKEAFISDLTGIEAFTALEEFSSQANDKNNAHKFFEIDFSQNTQLKRLNLSNNNLVRLDLSNNPNLESIDLSNNNLVNLNIANGLNSTITSLFVTNNYLSCIQVDTGFTNVQPNWSFDTGVTRQDTACDTYTYIPDDNFETALQNLKDDADQPLNLDSGTLDNKVLTDKINTLSLLNIGKNSDDPDSEKISDLTGIEDFTNLSGLFLENHLLASLNLSKNTNLTELEALGNKLTTVILPVTYNLSYLGLSINELSVIPNLENYTSLESLDLSNNNFTTLDISNLTNLTFVSLDANKFTSLDFSTNPNLTNIYVNEMKDGLLTSLNLKNIKSTNTSGNIASVDATDNPNLTCVTVDENVVANRPGIWKFDNTAQFSTDGNCTTVQYTTITDANFMQALIDGDHNITANDFDNDNKIETSKIENIEILKTTTDSKTYDVVTLQGLEDFKNLKELYTGSFVLETINVTNNLLLEKLVFGGPKITSLDVSKNTALDSLSIGVTKINTLNLASNTNLETLEVFDTPLQELNLENNTKLKTFNLANYLDTDITNNVKVTTLDLTKNIALETVNVAGIETLTAINIQNGENEKITQIGLNAIPNLKCLQIDDNFNPIDKNGWPQDISLYSYDCGTPMTYIPDDNFRAAIETLVEQNVTNFNNFNQIETAKISGITLLVLNGKNISNLAGIEDFSVLTDLFVFNNKLTSLDVSKNTALIKLYASDNELTSLDVSKNTALTELYVNENQLTSLDVSKNTDLIQLLVNENKLTSLDVSKNTALSVLDASSNQLTSLDVSKNIALTNLLVTYNQLTNLDVSKNLALEVLRVFSNPNLTCIQVNQTQLDNIPSGWQKDDTQNYSTDCSVQYTTIPDDNFRNALIDLGLTGFIGNKIETSKISVLTGALNVDGKEIKDLTGIEDFIGLSFLSAKNNKLKNLDLSKNIALQQIFLNQNELETLNLGQKNELLLLHAYDNKIKTLNLESATKLEILVVHNNEFESFDLSQNTALKDVWVDNNLLTSLDLSNNTALTGLKVNDNPNLTCIQVNQTQLDNIPSSWAKDATATYSTDCTPRTHIPDANFRQALIGIMDGNYNIEAEDFNAEDKIATSKISGITSLMLVGKNISNLAGIEDFTSLSELNADFNQLTSLDVSKNTALTDLLVNENKLTSLDVSKNIALIDLEVNSNQLTSLDVSNNTALTYLFVKNNKLTSLDVSNNIALTKLETKNNQLTNLDVSNNIALTKLETKNNQLTNLDVSNNTALTYLYVNNNLLTSLDLSNNTALTGLKVNDNPDLTCIQVNQTQLDNIPSDWQKDDTQNFSLDCSDVWVVNTADTQLDNALAAVTGLDTNNDGKITLAEAAAYTGVLDLKGKGLTNTDGLEAFTGASKIDLSNNQITNIDKLTDATEVEVVSKSGAKRTEKRAENKLETLDVSNNLIEKIDISKMKSLTSLIVSNNSLTKLILSNGNNAILTNMNATNNANLSCIQVDNVANALANGNWLKPTTVSYSTNCSAALGVTNETLLKHIAIYPNPVKSVLNITTNNGLSINNIEIYSMLGTRIVQTATQQINTKNLASGMYLLKIVTNNGIATSRFVKE